MPPLSSFGPPAAALLAAAVAAAAAAPPGTPERPRLRYPKAPRSAQADDYHGTKVADPFRPLEEVDAPATRKWVEAENRLTERFLAAVPERARIRKRVKELWGFERLSPPVREGERLFFTRADGRSDQPRLFVADGPDAAPRLLVDPNLLSADGTVAMGGWVPSRDGARLAFATTDGGSDWSEWRVRDVATGKDLPDRIRWVKFSRVAWVPDGSGFYYARYPEPPAGKEREAPTRGQELRFHRLGEEQGADRLVASRPDAPELGFEPVVSDDGRYLVLHVWKGTDRRNRLYYLDLEAKEASVVRLLDAADALYDFLGNDGSVFYLRTDRDAPRGKIVSVDLAAAAEGKPAVKTLVPESGLPIESASIVGDHLVLKVMKDATDRVRVHALGGTFQREVELPGPGTVSGFEGRRRDRDAFYSFTSFTQVPAVYRCDLSTGRSEPHHRPAAPFDASRYETKAFFATSKDGTKVPLFVVHRKGLALDGSHPALLTGYGGFGVSLTPSFSVLAAAWVERGGVFAQACVRGGGEYGEEWHRAGMWDRKQNSFDDFAAAAEWLAAKGYTAPARLAIQGASNGGLLVAATLNQRPELFGAAVVSVGVLDMLRYHRFTIGWAWIPEYGSSDDPPPFRWLEAYSPLQNVRKGASYPAVLVTTGDHDDRVVPGHSYKYAAALQEAQGGRSPILIRVDVRSGHGEGKPVSKMADEAADVLTFLTEVLRRRR